MRLHRHALHRWVSVFLSVHRYRCSEPTCGWEGVVGREPAGPAPAMVQTWRGRLAWMLGGAALAVAGMMPLLLATQRGPTAKPAVASASAEPVWDGGAETFPEAPGLHYEGSELLRADPRVVRNSTPLGLRRSCVWGVPGRTPYRGTVEHALKATQLLPPEVVQRISEMAAYGWTQERVEISRTAIRSIDGRRLFKPQIPAMAFGDALCFDTRVNFPPGHVEYAALYEAQDRAGKTYSVMVPYVCNNVSVLGVRAEREEPNGARKVPEPSSWLIVGPALGLMAWLRRRASGESA